MEDFIKMNNIHVCFFGTNEKYKVYFMLPEKIALYKTYYNRVAININIFVLH